MGFSSSPEFLFKAQPFPIFVGPSSGHSRANIGAWVSGDTQKWGNRRRETGNRKQETGDRRKETGNRKFGKRWIIGTRPGH